MLAHLAIENLAIIERTALDLADGLNVLTGETGAGKSIVLGALGLVLGDRARGDLVRRGAEQAEVQALVRVPWDGPVASRARALDLLAESANDGGTAELVLRRTIAAGGRGKAWINGVLVNVGTLAEVTRGLVDIASQHQHTALLDPGTHLALLDRFGGLGPERAAYDAAWEALGEARRALAALREREQVRLQREDYVRFQLGEIEAVEPRAGEDEELQQERERLAHGEKLLRGAREVETALAGRDGSATEQVLGAIRALERLVSVDPELGRQVGRLEAARVELEDVAFEMRRYGDRVEMDPRRLDAVEERLGALRRLKRKHGLELEGLVARAAELREELEAFEGLEHALERAEAAVAEREATALAAAEVLSQARASTAADLEALVARELADLAMAGAAIRFDLARRERLGADGIDAGQILIRTNVGEGLEPLARVASGGELSRLLLALKAAFVQVEEVPTSVFDEVDAGVGGAVGEMIALKLKAHAAHRQVIVITHLPQIAAHADHHLKVEKGARGGRTTTAVRALEEAERGDEIARMLGGVEVTRRAREHAAELLERGAGAAGA